MRKTLTTLEKRLAAYAAAAGVTLAFAPTTDAQIIHTDPPDICVNFSLAPIDIDGNGTPEFNILHSSFGGYYGDLNPYTTQYAAVMSYVGTAARPYVSALSASASIGPQQLFGSAYHPFSNLFGVAYGAGGAWQGGNDAFAGFVFTHDTEGTTHYGWLRLIVDAGGTMVCAAEWAYESTPDTAIHGGTVPVEMTSFDARVNGDVVVLNWETASETNNAGFEVQMRDGDDWNVLGFVEGHGTTTEAQTYNFTAENMAVGVHAFRLKQIDFDGAFEYSDEIEATIEVVGTHQLSNAYPNPFNPTSQFTLAVARDQRVTAELYNVLGQRVATLFDGTIEANNTQVVQIDGSALASGAYIVRIAGETFADALRVTLTK
ncbi:MAG: T9SS type A sorting domain-containing protein [Bacteroidetes bacterium]|nr:T9SS type A sorting domain-containing protein [Bacteroidota bacterium]